MAKYGYARVSSLSQSTDIQVDALNKAGCDMVRTEKMSGKTTAGRTELTTIIEFMRKGDSLCVHKLDRLGRNTRDVLNLVHELTERGCSLQVLEPAIDTSGQRAGIEAAKAKGVYKGRPSSLDHDKIKELRASGMGATAIAKELGCSRGAVYKAIA